MEMEREPPDGAGDSLLQSPTTNDKNDPIKNAGDLDTTSRTSLQKDTTETVCNEKEIQVSATDQSEEDKDTRTPQNTGTKEGSIDTVKYPILVLDTTEDKAALATAKDFVKDDLAMYGPQMEEEEEAETVREEENQDTESLNATENLEQDLEVEEQSESYEEEEGPDFDSLDGEEDQGSEKKIQDIDQDSEQGLKKVKDVDDDTAVFGAEGRSGKLGKDYVDDEGVNDQEDDDLMLIKEAEDKVKELQLHHRNHTLVVSNLQDASTTLQRIAAHQLRGEHHSGPDTENLAIRLAMAHKNAAQSCSQYNEVIRLFQDFLRRAKENASERGSDRELEDGSVVYVEDREEEASGIERPTSLAVNNPRDVNDDSLSSESSGTSRQIHTISPSQVGHYCKIWEQLREDGRVPEGRDGFFLDNIAWTWDDIGAVGQGTFGTVHLGQPQPYFAVKKVDMVKFEADEVNILAQLDHAAVVKLLAVVRDGNTMHICTEYLGDEVVERVINQNAGLSEPTALFITIQLLEGLVYLHSLGIVHRDVKAANVMLCRDTVPDRVQVKLIDFGSAKRIPKGHKWVHEEEREPKGTPTHMSPEMARAEEHNCTTDIWSLGCTTLHMLTGRHPWQKYAIRSFQLIYQIGAYPERILADIPHTTHGSLQRLLQHCFHDCWRERPQAQVILDMAWNAHKQVSVQATSTQDNVSLPSLQPNSLKASVASCLGVPPSSSSVLPPPPGVPPPPAQALTPALPPDSAQSTRASTEVSDPRDVEKMRRLLQELEMEEQEAVPPTTPVGSCQVAEDAVTSSRSRADQAPPLVKMPSFVPTTTLSQSVDMYRTWGQGEGGLASGMDSLELELGPDMVIANWASDLPADTSPTVATQDTEQTSHRVTTEASCAPNPHPSVFSVPTTGSPDDDKELGGK
ncbi:MAP3K19 [Branchiostoma lanceolatum]|uniref:MAP3K19 protein n=1 Tax=Branchiostoma lanceolatum TaxID=7740 RepID=A0A8J9ZEY6_BRALA|nr:MAP3K19 [Branchiostoma lanceolatum]